MKTLAGLLLTIMVMMIASCAQKDWIDRTLVTVDVTGTWSGSIASMGTAGGFPDLLFELE